MRFMRRSDGHDIFPLGLSVLAALAVATGAAAYFTTTGTGSASVGISALAAPTIPSATPGVGTVALTWSAVSAPGAGTVSDDVSRDGGAPEGNCPSSTSSSTADELHRYRGLDRHASLHGHGGVAFVDRDQRRQSGSGHLRPRHASRDNGSDDDANRGGGRQPDDHRQGRRRTTRSPLMPGLHNLTFEGAGNGPAGDASNGVKQYGGGDEFRDGDGDLVYQWRGDRLRLEQRRDEALQSGDRPADGADGTINNGAGLSVTVAAATAASFSMTAASTTPTAGEADNLTITALDAFGNVALSYTGSHSLTFGGAGTSVGGNHPTVSTSAGVVTSFGTATAVVFTNGVATVAGANNGVMRLYKAETAGVTVASGAVTNGAGLSVTVSVAAASSLGLAAASTTPTAGTSDSLTITAKEMPMGIRSRAIRARII